jgi:exodeoxyribonuclease VII large subunit
LVSPNGEEWLQSFITSENRLIAQMRRQQQGKAQALQWLNTRLAQQHPGRRLRDQGQRLDELEQRFNHAWRSQMRHAAARLHTLTAQLHRHDPSRRLQHLQFQRDNLGRRLVQAMKGSLQDHRQRLAGVGRALEAVSPLATLSRGYAIVKRLPDGAIVRAADAVNLGDRIETRVAQGRLISTVDEKYET